MPLEELTVDEDEKFWIPQKKSPGIIATGCAKCNGVIILKNKLLGKKKIS
jgi:hypothetical protein